MESFKNKIAVVTGGGGDGIGNALCVALAKAGATVAFCDIAKLDATTRDIEALGASCYAAEVDIGDREAVSGFIDDVVARFGGIDILINNAGIALGDRGFEELSIEDFERITRINYWGVVHTTLLAHPHIMKSREGAIVNLSSSQGILGLPFLVPYCTTKFAVRGFTDALRAEHRLRGAEHVQVHTVHPGAVATNITLNADYHNDSTQAFHRMLQKGTDRHEAAAIILKGMKKNRARIMISDGRAQDILTRLLPTACIKVVGWLMRRRGMAPRPMTHKSV
ncbi:SDR family NAD(P)-dependent oxidoreductase [Salinisphaera japonica]|uniref:Short-chain dehydrogenase n=1 Tax=Salinisphaera japonica YTM-1 TaxID=1209778 RepID=A0A423Q0K7_9GAMM|nr:SDR family NAD(P)-dependent oxidoreductase [Salinisphaera japonica]ROO31412.1 short-chain dehydrogenase [Salinisphaera japonica YTM-1]